LVHRCTVAISQKPANKNLEKGRGLGHVTPITFGVHANVSPKKCRARDLKFGTQMHSGNISKTRKEKSRKWSWPRSRDPHKFWLHPNVSPKRVELETWKLVQRCTMAIPQKPAKKNLEKGRCIGHVTLRIFGILYDISKTCKHICKPLLKIL